MRPKFVLLYAIFVFWLTPLPNEMIVFAGEPTIRSASAEISAMATVINPLGFSSLKDGNSSMVKANHNFLDNLNENCERDYYRVLWLPNNQNVAIMINNNKGLGHADLLSGSSEEILYINLSDLIMTNQKIDSAIVITIAPIDN
ncbi:MAG: hypothetical protein V3V99_05920 [candidate division Zixibacteria bacterium]